ncbi:MAG: GNAT family N-acetyltransferase [Anaerolineae bacterium]|nr:GNAT family N-acetyltransferase [Anaerolineae bacterium]
MSENITLRVLHTMDDFAKIVELEQIVWQMALENTASPPVMNAISHNGGSVIGAEIDGVLVGFCFGFPAKNGDEISLWSHMAGVHPNYQGRGIGVLLKQEQRIWALKNGYIAIRWTFDPLQRGNANFNFNCLGTIARKYHVNHYGEMTDEINIGLASDRLEALWDLNDAHVVMLANGHSCEENKETFPEEAFLLHHKEGDIITYDESAPLMLDAYCIEIPYHIATLKKDNKPLAITWQLAIREAMLYTLAQGYIIRDFIMRDDRCWYVIRKN